MKRLFAAPLLFCLIACSRQSASLLSCENIVGNYDMHYTGSTYGAGRLSLAIDKKNSHGVFATLFLYTPNDNESKALVLQIEGTGDCVDSTVRIRFGGGGTYGKIKIIGGTLIGVFRPEVQDDPFGTWRMDILDGQDKQQHLLAGYWNVSKPNTDLLNKVADAPKITK